MSSLGCRCFRREIRASAEQGTVRARLLGVDRRCRHHSASPADLGAHTLVQGSLCLGGSAGPASRGSRREVSRVVLGHGRRCHALRHVRLGIHYLGGCPRLRACR